MTISIPGYEVFEKIGLGGMAVVYRAKHIRLDRYVALKVMLDKLNDDPSFGERFIREARIAAGLRHPNIIQVYDVDRFDKLNYLSMEFVSGVDLKKKLNQDLDKNQILDIVKPVALALDYAHKQGYIHRDIKPANILFRDDGAPVVSDFGIARAIHSDTHMTNTGDVIGTPSYMSPEQAQGRQLDGRSDLYSLAVIVFQMLTRLLPFDGDSSITVAVKHVTAPVPQLDEPLRYLQAFFDTALAKDPAQRFQTGSEMAAALETLFANSGHGNPNYDPTRIMVSKPAGAHLASSAETLTGEKPVYKNMSLGSRSDQPSAAHTLARPKAQLMERMFNYQKPLLGIAGFVLLLLCVGIYWRALNTGGIANLTPGQQQRIEQLFASAEMDMVAQRFSLPPGDNAYEKYLAILAIAPGNPEASVAIDRVVEQLLKNADIAIENAQWQPAAEFLEQARSIDPAFPGLDQFEQKWMSSKQSSLERLARLLDAANEFKRAGDWSSAANAFVEVLRQDPVNTLAKQGIADILKGHLLLSGRAVAEQNFSRADEHIQSAERITGSVGQWMDISAESREITALKRQVDQASTTKERRERVERLNSDGDRALAAGRLVEPGNSSAYSFYKQAQAIDHGNQHASSGIEKVINRLSENARAAISQGNAGAGETHIGQLENIAPGHSQLADLKASLKQIQRQQEQQQAVRRKLDVLYDRAARYLAAERAPSAEKMYLRIVDLSASDPGLSELRRKLADGYELLANKEFQARDWRDAIEWADRGLVHVPDHKGLLELRAKASAARR